jgi:DNA (cytosine-5)-methyltransferase 1
MATARATQALNPSFVHWLMGLPAGYLTQVPGLTRGALIRLGGNGVVPQQGAAALAYLLARSSAAAAA